MNGKQLVDAWVKHQFDSNGPNPDPHKWTQDYVARAYAPTPALPEFTFVSNPISTESLILWSAVQREVADENRVSNELGREIAKRAKKDRHTDQLARSVVLQAAREVWALPDTMQDFAEYVVAGGGKTGRRGERGWKFINRDRIGATAMLVLTSQDGFRLQPMRNPTSTSFCARDVLCHATGHSWASITPDIADGIWRRRNLLFLEFEKFLTLAIATKSGSYIDRKTAFSWLAELDALRLGQKNKNKPNDKLNP